MALNNLFKRSKKTNISNKPALNNNKSEIVKSWMADDYQQDEQDTILDLPIIDDNFLDQKKVSVAKDPRIETSILKNRIAEKMKKLNTSS